MLWFSKLLLVGGGLPCLIGSREMRDDFLRNTTAFGVAWLMDCSMPCFLVAGHEVLGLGLNPTAEWVANGM